MVDEWLLSRFVVPGQVIEQSIVKVGWIKLVCGRVGQWTVNVVAFENAGSAYPHRRDRVVSETSVLLPGLKL